MKPDIPIRKQRKLPKEQIPIIFFNTRSQQMVWECVLKDEIDTGYWSKVKFEKNRYLLAKTFVHSKTPGISFPPALMSFDFNNLDYIEEKGYYISLVMKLSETYTLDLDEMKSLAGYAESFIMTDFHDENSNYRRVQVGYISPDDRQLVSTSEREAMKQTEAYFRNRGIDMEHLIRSIKDQPKSVREVRSMMSSISKLLKNKVDVTKLLEKATK